MIVAIILNWNNSDQTLKLIKNLESIEKHLNYIIVDNNSKSEEIKKLTSFFYTKEKSQVISENIFEKNEFKINYKYNILLLENNYGYAKGNNYGLRLAEKLKAKYVIVMNNDIEIENPFISTFVEEFEKDQKIAIMSGKIIGPFSEQGPNRMPNMFDWFFYPLFLPFLILPKKYLEKKSNKNVWFTGCFLFIRLDIFKKVGFFDENNFLYLEEPMIFKRIYEKGYNAKKIDEVIIKHYHGMTTSKISKKKKFYYLKDAINYYFKNYENYGNLKIKLIIIANYVRFFFWEPIIFRIIRILRHE